MNIESFTNHRLELEKRFKKESTFTIERLAAMC